MTPSLARLCSYRSLRRRWRFALFMAIAVLWMVWPRAKKLQHPIENGAKSVRHYHAADLDTPHKEVIRQFEKVKVKPEILSNPGDGVIPKPRPIRGTRTYRFANNFIEFEFRMVQVAPGHRSLALVAVTNLRTSPSKVQHVHPEIFTMVSYNQELINSTKCNVTSLDVDNTFGMQQMATAELDCPFGYTAVWTVTMQPNEHFFRVRLQWMVRTIERSFQPQYILLLTMPSPRVENLGSVLGSPMLTSSQLFLGVEHPLSINGVTLDDMSVAVCGISYIPVYKQPGQLNHGFTMVVGSVSEQSQVRRQFGDYIEMTRAHPSRPFLHYNSWFDFASWQEPNSSLHYRSMTETICLDRVQTFGKKLIVDRDVIMDSFLWDDGWDNQSSLWDFNQRTFPRGFDLVGDRAKSYNIGTGVWVSPWGGYGEAKDSRLRVAKQYGYETNEDGFVLSGPKYFKRFKEIMLSMVTRYGVNMFKVDGIGFEGNHTVIATEMEGLLSLFRELRLKSTNKHLFLSLTTGTWPSPFWLQHGDSVWRGHGDLGLEGDGSRRQMWITYRDAVVYHMVVKKSMVFPLSALMLHGIILGAVGQSRAAGLDQIGNFEHFQQEVWSYFAMGVLLQELYISPDLMTDLAWNVVATAAKWARKRSKILKDSHWIGSDPLRSVYGFASWCEEEEMGVILLRNPTKRSAQVSLEIADALNFPSEYSKTAPIYSFKSIFGGNKNVDTIFERVAAGSTIVVPIAPLGVLLLEGQVLFRS